MKSTVSSLRERFLKEMKREDGSEREREREQKVENGRERECEFARDGDKYKYTDTKKKSSIITVAQGVDKETRIDWLLYYRERLLRIITDSITLAEFKSTPCPVRRLIIRSKRK